VPYSIEMEKSAAKALSKLETREQNAIVKAIDGLAHDPRPDGVKKLSGQDNLWRIRAGDYRIIYTISDKRLIVLVLNIGHRKDVYR
jgi:mRNA interferase RelE/StbE